MGEFPAAAEEHGGYVDEIDKLVEVYGEMGKSPFHTEGKPPVFNISHPPGKASDEEEKTQKNQGFSPVFGTKPDEKDKGSCPQKGKDHHKGPEAYPGNQSGNGD